MKKIILIVTVCIFILVALTGCNLLQTLGLQKNTNDELRPVSSIVMSGDEADKLAGKAPIHLYFANEDNSKLELEVRYIPLEDIKQSTSHLASVIVKELIKGPMVDGLKATIPAETKLRTPVSIKAGVAAVDLSKEFQSKHQSGKDAEEMTIFSIVDSLTELDGIQKVKFTIDGKTQKEYMGYYQFDAPFPRTVSLISKEAVIPGANLINDGSIKQDDTKDMASQKKPASGDSQETSGGDASGDGSEILE